VQMQRETDTLRALSGRLGEGDLETVLGAMASAWPDGRAPLDSLSFAPGKLSMSSSGWTDEQLMQFQTSLKPAGWVVEKGTGVVTVSRAKNSGAS
jgi:general secretion pathway protein L